MMLFTVVAAIPDIFHMFYFDQAEINRGVRRRMLNRRVKAADLNRNKGEILAEKVRDMEVQNEAQQMFRMLNSEKLIHQRVRQMEANAEATEIFKRENADRISERRISDMERSYLERKAFKRQNHVELMAEKRFDGQESASVRKVQNFGTEVDDAVPQRVANEKEEGEQQAFTRDTDSEKKALHRKRAQDYYNRRNGK